MCDLLQVGDASDGSDQTGAAAGEGGETHSRGPVTSSTGFAGDADITEESSAVGDAGGEPAAAAEPSAGSNARTRGNKPPAGKARGRDGRRVAVNARKADERRMSAGSDAVVGNNDSPSRAGSTNGSGDGVTGASVADKAGSVTHTTAAEGRESRRTRPADVDVGDSADGYEDGAIPPLHLAGSREALDGGTPPASNRKLKVSLCQCAYSSRVSQLGPNERLINQHTCFAV